MSSISTTRGDGGETGLLGGERVPKDHPRVEAVGTLDELTSFLGDAKYAAVKPRTREIIETIQHQLVDLMTSLAATGTRPAKVDDNAEPAEAAINAWVKEFEAGYSMRGFVLPGRTAAAAKIDIARTVCRRAERRIVTLNRLEPVSPPTLRCINRLSDLLFFLARYEEEA
jgi:cob(I)alamin adenosyltransferase